MLILWNLDAKSKEEEVEIVLADNRPFMVNDAFVEAIFYDFDIGLVRFIGKDKFNKLIGFTNATSVITREFGLEVFKTRSSSIRTIKIEGPSLSSV